jgi:hypothetical protein
MPNNIVQFSNPIKVTLHTKEEDNEVIIIGYVNYGYDIILVDENNYHIEMEELIKPHQRFIMDIIKSGNI